MATADTVLPTSPAAAPSLPESPPALLFLHSRPRRSRCFQWIPTDEGQLEESERHMLHGLQYEPRLVGGTHCISSPGWNDPHNGKKETVVLLHGFGGGKAIWAQNWEALSARYNVHALDLPGFGRSIRDDDVKFADTEQAIAFYETHLDAWFAHSDLPPEQPVTLVGHSFGAYVAAQYVCRSLKKQFASTPPNTSSGNTSSPVGREPSTAAATNFVTANSDRHRIHHLILADPWGVPRMTDEDRKRVLPLKFRLAIKLFNWFAPLSFARAAGPWGPDLLPRIRPDFASRWSNLPDPNIFYDYFFHCNAQSPPTGELAFKACCHGPGYAKHPLCDALPSALDEVAAARASCSGDGATRSKRQGGSSISESSRLSSPFPRLSVMYGSDTWMSKNAGFQLLRRLRDGPLGLKTCGAVISNAGHQLNTDNAAEFNETLVAIMEKRHRCVVDLYTGAE